MRRPWLPDELQWARDCLHAGDSIEEIAQAAGRTTADVDNALTGLPRLTPTQRKVLSLYTAGCTLDAIDRERGITGQYRPGHAARNMLSELRRKGIPIPHRQKVAA